MIFILIIIGIFVLVVYLARVITENTRLITQNTIGTDQLVEAKSVPRVEISSVSRITSQTAIAIVQTKGMDIYECFLYYGPDQNRLLRKSNKFYTDKNNISILLTDLVPATLYFYQLVVKKSTFPESYYTSPWANFTTLKSPNIVTSGAVNITQKSAMVYGMIYSNGSADLHYAFKYKPIAREFYNITPSYPVKTCGNNSYCLYLTNLLPNTTYQFSIFAFEQSATSVHDSNEHYFTTTKLPI